MRTFTSSAVQLWLLGGFERAGLARWVAGVVEVRVGGEEEEVVGAVDGEARLARRRLLGVGGGLEAGSVVRGRVRGVRGAGRGGEEAWERRNGMVEGVGDSRVGVVGDSRFGVEGLVEVKWKSVLMVVSVVLMDDVLIGKVLVLLIRANNVLPIEVLFF